MKCTIDCRFFFVLHWQHWGWGVSPIVTIAIWHCLVGAMVPAYLPRLWCSRELWQTAQNRRINQAHAGRHLKLSSLICIRKYRTRNSSSWVTLRNKSSDHSGFTVLLNHFTVFYCVSRAKCEKIWGIESISKENHFAWESTAAKRHERSLNIFLRDENTKAFLLAKLLFERGAAEWCCRVVTYNKAIREAGLCLFAYVHSKRNCNSIM